MIYIQPLCDSDSLRSITDFIPDLLGPLGYTDDISALMWALSRIWHNITPAVHEKSRARLRQWFPGVEESDLTLF